MARAQAATRSTTTSDFEESVLGRGTRLRGRIAGDASLRIEGQVEGDVTIGGDLAIEVRRWLARGNFDVLHVHEPMTLSLSMLAVMSARGPVVIRAAARVTGNMGGAEVSLEEGAAFVGRIDAEFDLPPELEDRQGGR